MQEIFKERTDKSKNGKWYFAEKKSRKDGSEYYIYKARPLDSVKFKSSNSYEGLVELFFDLYAYDEQPPQTLENIYCDATIWKSKQPNIASKTIYNYKQVWDKYIKDSNIAKLNPQDIDYDVLTDFYETACLTFGLKYKQVQDIRNVISYIMKYCLKQHLISHNPALDVDYNSLPYAKSSGRKDKIKKTPFTPAQTHEVELWCDKQLTRSNINPLHPLGIKFGLVMGDRYGELRALKWKNVDFQFQTITVEDQAVEHFEINDDLSMRYKGRQSVGHIKGYEAPIALPMPDTIKEILLQIKAMDLDSEYIFPENHFRYGTFNDKIKAAAAAIGLNPTKYTTHTLRATAATNLYLKTHDIYQVQMLLHHTTPEMTMKYIKDLDINERLRKSMMEGLSGNKTQE